jgi:hypothetical protein
MKATVRVCVASMMLAFFFYFSNLSFYHSWAADGPGWRHLPKQLKGWHECWAAYFSDLAFFSLSTFSAYVGWNLFQFWRDGQKSAMS